MAKPTVEELLERIALLERALAGAGIQKPLPRGEPGRNPDYVEPGSEQHAAILGLKRAEEGDIYVHEGWTFLDPGFGGPTATREYVMLQLRGKVGALSAMPPAPQSKDPAAPSFAPVMWLPGQPFSKITED